jgi:uncharacterized protein (UPF0276 family)
MRHPAALRVPAPLPVPTGVPAQRPSSVHGEHNQAPVERRCVRTALPTAAGIGLRAPHVKHVLANLPAVPWFEVHSENYFVDGGPTLAGLERIRAHYPLSLHGVGMSLGSVDPLDTRHLAKLKRLAQRIEPEAISEHLCWNGVDARHFNDLLPLPYTEEALRHVCARIDAVQTYLGRPMLVENVSSYYAFPEDAIPEGEFVAAVAARTGCALLLDVNNIHVNACNHGIDPHAYLDAIPPATVAEIHLAGFDASGPCVIDTHGAPVAPEVWALYERAVARFGCVPTLIEWDTDIPEFAVLAREAATAQATLDRSHGIPR